MIAAYALAMQALLGAVAMGQLASADPFVICHTNADGQPDQTPNASHDCQLCTLAKGFAAVLGPEQALAARTIVLSPVAPVIAAARIFIFHSPTGQYQRGPPAVLAG
jgi:hypothetical protein